jgi:hypothetical protein
MTNPTTNVGIKPSPLGFLAEGLHANFLLAKWDLPHQFWD